MRHLKASIPVLALVACVTSGCAGSSHTQVAAANEKAPLPTAPIDAGTQLAGLAAMAKDRHFTAGYTFQQPGHPARTVTVVLAADGSWRVDIPGGALGGQVDMALAGNPNGMFQCRTSGAAPTCAKVADAAIPAWADPQVQHPFVDWLDPLTDRQAPLSVASAPLPPGARGACFSVEADTAALAPPVDPGVYCYDTDGTLTAVKAGFGSVVLATAVAPAPATIGLPGPVTAGPLLPTGAPAPAPSAPGTEAH